MKNRFLLILFLIASHQSFSMDTKPVDVFYMKGFDDTEIPAMLWEKIRKDVRPVDISEHNIEALIIDPNRDTFVYGTFCNKDAFAKALGQVDLGKKSITIMKKKGDNKYDDIFREYKLPDITVDTKEFSYIDSTWSVLSKESPPPGLALLGNAYTTNPSKDAWATREFLVTEGGTSFEKKKEVVYIIIDADENKLKGIIRLGEAYLAKVKSLDDLAISTGMLLNINNARVVFLNVQFGRDRLTRRLLSEGFKGNDIDGIIFNRVYSFDDGKHYQYGLRSNNPNIDVGAIARTFGNEAGGYQNGKYSEGGFFSDMDIFALKKYFEENNFYKH